jgi:predicted MFS family arabinose efflux permease
VAGWSASADAAAHRPRWLVVGGLGVGQVFAWGSSYYLIAALAEPIARATGWGLPWVMGGASVGFLVSGLISPRVGALIEAHGGRPVMAGGTVLLAAGLAALAAAPSLAAYFVAWAIVGAGMGTGLYDPAFAALGRLYGEQARGAITQVTLFGGIASTVCWPLSALFAAHVGWRGACAGFAVIQLGAVLPLYLLVLPAEPPLPPPRTAAAAEDRPAQARRGFLLVAMSLTLASVVMTMVAVHLLTLLRARGVDMAAAVAIGALIGPSQVVARLLEMLASRWWHPLWTMLASTVLVALGLALLLADIRLGALAIVLYGTGSGIRSIVRGTVPLALFGRNGYARLMGKLAMPSLVAQAAVPALGGLLIARAGVGVTLWLLVGAAALNIVPAALLLPLAHGRRVRDAG